MSDLVEEVRGFARRRPGTFLLGALATGMIAGRFTRGAKAAQDEPGSDDKRTDTPDRGPSYADPPIDPTPVSHPTPDGPIESVSPIPDTVGERR